MPMQLVSDNFANVNRRQTIKEYPILEALALDMFWSWNHGGDLIWKGLDPEMWELTHNPWVILQTVSNEKLMKSLADPAFVAMLETLWQQRLSHAEAVTWFQTTFPEASLAKVAYFSMEFMLSEALPIYSGGLGNVAGDQLKAASDLGVPVVGVGLLYQQGYFRQKLDSAGTQVALYPYNDPGQLPIVPLRKPNGEWLRLEIKLPGNTIWLRTWQVKIGNVMLYLIDSNDPANPPSYRAITSELYGGNRELRLQQEIVLGIGGWRLLQAIGLNIEVCHLNEGHAAFAVLDRAYSFMLQTQQPFDVALAATRAGNLFTTHTAVPAGFDCFNPALIKQYLENYAQTKLNISIDKLLSLGRLNESDPHEEFNMAYLAMHGSGAINAVSKLHQSVSKQIFAPMFPRWPEKEIPIDFVTNGVHMSTWDSKAADRLWSEKCGKERWLGATEHICQSINELTDEQIWSMRNDARQATISYARAKLARMLAERGASQVECFQAAQLFDPNTLTLGFARRFATYKRPNLLLHDKERLLSILTHNQRPVQLILAGKAHPADLPGQALIKEWMEFISHPSVRPHVIFLADYDMTMTEQLVSGVDVWINTPRRPWEACGTSGMKILVNGGLNVSELDGWWAEAYTPEVGWAIGHNDSSDNSVNDAADAADLYRLIENEIVPQFYNRNQEGLPATWIAKIRKSMATLTAQYSANRSVRQYTEQHYMPAAKAYRQRASQSAATAQEIVRWRELLKQHWKAVRFGDVSVETQGNEHHFDIQVYCDDLPYQAIKVELYHCEGAVEMNWVRELTATKMHLYRAQVSAKYPATYYTPRIVPYLPQAIVPLEANQILWLH